MIGRPTSGASPSFTVLRMIAVEDVVVADDAQLVEHVPREVGAAVVERRQEAEDLAARRFSFSRIVLMTLTRLVRPFIA